MERSIRALREDYADVLPEKNDFKQLLIENTQDHAILIVDQTKAHYDTSEMFFIDHPELEVEPFKIGDKKFWKESHANWEEQLEKFERIPPNDSKHWKNTLDDRWKEDEHFEEEQEQIENQLTKTNNPNLAAPEIQEQMHNDYMEQHKLKKSQVQLANEVISNTNLFNYQSGIEYNLEDPPKLRFKR